MAPHHPHSSRRMNCREFRRKHDAYVDDTLSGVDIEGMNRHLRLCEPCAALDTRIRRSLLIARNLPTIQPSAAFGERLQMRLAQERALMANRQQGGEPILGMMTGRRNAFSSGTFVALAAGIAVAAGVSVSVMLTTDEEDRVIRLAPVVATLPEPEPSPIATPAMVASMPAGMPIWPAVFVAQRAPLRLASDVAGR
jgi:Putative zinc-finger